MTDANIKMWAKLCESYDDDDWIETDGLPNSYEEGDVAPEDDFEDVSDTDTCPNCGETIDPADPAVSSGKCPHCGLPFEDDEDEPEEEPEDDVDDTDSDDDDDDDVEDVGESIEDPGIDNLESDLQNLHMAVENIKSQWKSLDEDKQKQVYKSVVHDIDDLANMFGRKFPIGNREDYIPQPKFSGITLEEEITNIIGDDKEKMPEQEM